MTRLDGVGSNGVKRWGRGGGGGGGGGGVLAMSASGKSSILPVETTTVLCL